MPLRDTFFGSIYIVKNHHSSWNRLNVTKGGLGPYEFVSLQRLILKGGFIYFSAQYCQKYYLNIFAKYMAKYHKSDTYNRNLNYF